MSLSSDEDFVRSIADTVALVARGDIAAFEVAGQTDVGLVGQARFTQTLVTLAQAAKAHGRKVTLRWRCDPVGSEAATQRTVANITKLQVAIKAASNGLAQTGDELQALVAIEFINVGSLPSTLVDALADDDVATPDLIEQISDSANLFVWDTSDPAQAWLGEYEVNASGSNLLRHQSVPVAKVAPKQNELQRRGKRQGSTVGGFALWAFDETGEVWTKQGCLASGPRNAWLVGKTQVTSTSVVAVTSFYNQDDYGHRGVKIQLRSAVQVVVVEEFDPSSKHDPTYNRDNLAVDGAWASHLGKALAGWLNCTHRDELP